MFPPPCGTIAGADFAIETSEVAATPACVVEAVELSLPVLSFGVRVIGAVFVNVLVLAVVFAGTVTTIVTVAELLPAASVPRLHVTFAARLPSACDAVEDTNVVPAGIGSLTVTFVAAVFPVCEAERKNVVFGPSVGAVAGAGVEIHRFEAAAKRARVVVSVEFNESVVSFGVIVVTA